jgi:glycosyltransferase involved in cell wall biosynthesis
MKIGVDINEANVIGRVGSNQYAFEILSAMEKQDKKNDFTLYSSSPPVGDLPKGRENWNYKVVTPSVFWTQWRLPMELFRDREKLDVFFSLGHYAPRFSPVPTVVSAMDLAYLIFPKFYRKKDAAQLISWSRYSMKRASKVIAISQNTKNDLKKHYNLKDNKVAVAYPGYSKNRYKRTSVKTIMAVREKYNLPKRYILYLGTLQPRKNLIRLIEAYEESFDNEKDLGLVISGKQGWLYKNLVQKINKSEKKSLIRLTGFVDQEDIPALYSGAECFVLPGLYEGFGIPALESMACGTVPVVSSTGALPEVVGKAGILVEPYEVSSIGQGLKKAVQLTSSEKVKWEEKAKTQLGKFSWEKSAKIVLEVLYDVAGS